MSVLGLICGLLIIGLLGVFSYRNIVSIVESRKKAKAEKEKKEKQLVNSSEDETNDSTKTNLKN